MNPMDLPVKRLSCLIVLAIVMFLHAIGQPAFAREYTEEKPLVYEDAWDLWPYVYLNERGIPEGYNVDLLKELFSELKIPYVIKLKPTAEALEDLKAGRSDLMLRLKATFHDDYAAHGKEAVQLFTHSVVSPKSKNLKASKIEDLTHHQVIVHTGSLSHRMLLDAGHKSSILPYNDMKEAIQQVSSEDKGVIIWNTLSLRWLMKKFQTDNLEITPIDVPYGEYRFMSKDTVLLEQLDKAYARLRATERLQPIQNKWFYPERVDTGIPDWLVYVIAVALILAFLLSYYVIVLQFRKHRMSRLSTRQNQRLALILRTTGIRVWLYDVRQGTVAWINDKGGVSQEKSYLLEYAGDYTPETFSKLEESLALIADGRKDSCVQELVSNKSQGYREYVLTLSVFRRSKRGVPEVIVGMMDDQTERLLTQRKAKSGMLRYQSIFSTSMVDMTYYNQEGILTDINQKACETFRCSREELLAERVPFNYALEDLNVTIENFEGAYTTHIIKAQANGNLADAIGIRNDVYYEQQLLPVYDDNNRFLGIFGSGRDVSEFVNSYHQLKSSITKLTSAAEDISDYINNINYALHAGGVRLVDYSPSSHTLTIFKEMNKVQIKLTQSRCLSLVDEQSKRQATRLLNSLDMRSDDTVDIDIKTIIRQPGGRKLSIHFNMFPIHNIQGEVESYFGLCRDISQEKATEEELEREKTKAQEVEYVKNAFLHNMSYEIRTPITTVVGFAELFVQDHDPADEGGFIEEIKKNSTFLLKLVNDILFLSRLDAHMVEFHSSPIDFAGTFEGHCQMGWAKLMKPSVSFAVENPYEHLVLNIDDSNVGHIIEQLAENAARYTDNGSVKARYDYIGGKLLITITDTGRGIDTANQEELFKRFNNTSSGIGTGLGLPICQELAQQMGGAVYLNSAKGKGTTVWVVIPCEAIQIEKKLEKLT